MKHDQNYGMKALWAYVRSLGPLGKPSREWRGLTHEEIDQITEQLDETTIGWSTHEFAQAIESKLKQKNGYAEEKNT